MVDLTEVLTALPRGLRSSEAASPRMLFLPKANSCRHLCHLQATHSTAVEVSGKDTASLVGVHTTPAHNLHPSLLCSHARHANLLG